MLYKAKRIDNNEWIYGYLYRLSETHNPFIMMSDRHGESHEVDINTVCRCTGKEYMDGEIAYEGDIIESQLCGVKMIIKYGTYEAYCPVDRCYIDNVGFFAEAEGYPQMPIGSLNDYALKIGTIFDK